MVQLPWYFKQINKEEDKKGMTFTIRIHPLWI